ncbi:hypothetical protein SAMN05518872_103146 [Psychrobacillus sp. OK032]|nr:hypothetical protein SAMN05518872_103146 [Psychrobacillus sp. OK032]
MTKVFLKTVMINNKFNLRGCLIRIKVKIVDIYKEVFIRQGPPRRLLWEQLELKTPQERSDEEAEAKPTESEVVVLAEFIQLSALQNGFLYSLKCSLYIVRTSYFIILLQNLASLYLL